MSRCGKIQKKNLGKIATLGSCFNGHISALKRDLQWLRGNCPRLPRSHFYRKSVEMHDGLRSQACDESPVFQDRLRPSIGAEQEPWESEHV